MLQEKSNYSIGTERNGRAGLQEANIRTLKEESVGELKVMKFGYVKVRKFQVKGTSYPQMCY